MNETQKKKVGGTPTLNKLSANELLGVLLRRLENVKSQAGMMRLLAQQRRWAELVQAEWDLGKVLYDEGEAIREVRRRLGPQKAVRRSR